ncbi:MAG: AMP-binding protein [Gammaproteobacteria bacterium]|nr:AMP-binding protein [Gammaproteobacteria bacterium]
MNLSKRNSERVSYEGLHKASIESPNRFWHDVSNEIEWIEQPKQVLSADHNGVDRWFEGGKLNTAWLCLDRHVEAGRGDQIALIYDSPVTGTLEQYSFSELTRRVSHIAGALQKSGVGTGDRVVIYMPMIPETVMAMLACARIGAVHSVVFGGFAGRELATRIEDATPKLLLTATCGIEFDRVVRYMPLVDEALRLSSFEPGEIVVLQRDMAREPLDKPGFVDWHYWMSSAMNVDAVPTDAWDPLYILYTSGTTGKPKGVVRDCGSHAVALTYSMSAIYGCGVGDVFWAAS